MAAAVQTRVGLDQCSRCRNLDFWCKLPLADPDRDRNVCCGEHLDKVKFIELKLSEIDVRRGENLGCPMCSAILGVCRMVTRSFTDDPNRSPFEIVLRLFSDGQTGMRVNSHNWIHFYVPPGHPKAWDHLPVRREIAASADSADVMAFLNDQLEICLRDHARCRAASTEVGPPSFLPTRLVAVGAEGCDTVHLVETAGLAIGTGVDATARESTRYTALSYCWGDGKALQLTQATLGRLVAEGVRVADLPQTLRDAVLLTRRLGVGYVWIDALCILQDSKADWEAQSAVMGTIYTRSYLTIAAASAGSAGGGFLRPRRQLPELDSIIVAAQQPHGVFRVRYDHHQWRYRNWSVEPWDRRGWTLQEHMLSTRLIIFSDHEARFSCRTAQACECGSRDVSEVVSQELSVASLAQMATPIEAHRFWHLLVSNFTNRRFSVAEDKLPALSGIVARMTAITGSAYLAGLWRDTLVSDMVWRIDPVLNKPKVDGALVRDVAWFPWWIRPVQDEHGVDEAPVAYRAPSFSWASVDRLVLWESFIHLLEPPDVVDLAVSVDGQNPFGRVSDGHVTLRGYLKPCTAVINTPIGTANGSARRPTLWWCLEGWPGEFWSFFSGDQVLCSFAYGRDGSDGVPLYSAARYSSVLRAGLKPKMDRVRLDVWVLYLGHVRYEPDSGGSTQTALFYLILGKAPRDPSKYERVSLLRPDKLLHDVTKAPLETITII